MWLRLRLGPGLEPFVAFTPYDISSSNLDSGDDSSDVLTATSTSCTRISTGPPSLYFNAFDSRQIVFSFNQCLSEITCEQISGSTACNLMVRFVWRLLRQVADIARTDDKLKDSMDGTSAMLLLAFIKS